MNLGHRIDRLERDLGGVGEICPHGPQLIRSYGSAWLTQHPKDSLLPIQREERCRTCGLKRRIIRVVWDCVSRSAGEIEGSEQETDGQQDSHEADVRGEVHFCIGKGYQ